MDSLHDILISKICDYFCIDRVEKGNYEIIEFTGGLFRKYKSDMFNLPYTASNSSYIPTVDIYEVEFNSFFLPSFLAHYVSSLWNEPQLVVLAGYDYVEKKLYLKRNKALDFILKDKGVYNTSESNGKIFILGEKNEL